MIFNGFLALHSKINYHTHPVRLPLLESTKTELGLASAIEETQLQRDMALLTTQVVVN